MKKLILGGFLLILVACFAYFGGNYVMYKTGDDKFCNLCHSWMNPMTEAYLKGSHGGENYLGAKASCVSCHLPHDASKMEYVFQKALNGIAEVTHMAFNDPKKYDWVKNQERREKYVFDSGCLSCHANIENAPAKNDKIKMMHQKYQQQKNAKGEERLTCVSCHKDVGHEDLGKILHEIKYPPIGSWGDALSQDKPQ